jgi:hypothetical protein
MPHTERSIPHKKVQPAPRWPNVVIVVVTLLAFCRLFAADFSCWDDIINIQKNPLLNPPSLQSLQFYWSHSSYGLYVPVTYTVWLAIAAVSRVQTPDVYGATLNPWIFHLANIVVHVCTAVMVYQLLRRLFDAPIAAMFGALLWAIHPVQVETVGWISGMKDLLAGCFGVAALWRYVVHVQSRPPDANPWVPDWIATIALLLAVLSKPSAMMVPAMAFVIDAMLIGRGLRRAFQSTAVWFVLELPLAIVARVAQDVSDLAPVPLWARPFIAGDAIALYLAKLVVPFNLAVDYGRRPWQLMHSPMLWLTSIATLLLAVLLLIARKRAPWLAASGLVFLLPLLPVSGLAMFQFQYMSTTADHYLYLAMLGPAIAIACLIKHVPSRVTYSFATVIVLLLSIRTVHQSGFWLNDEALFRHTLDVNPNSFMAHNNLGNFYLLHGAIPTALDEYRKSIELNEDYVYPYQNLAGQLEAMGEISEANRVREKWRSRAKRAAAK